mmetsp:Transcript_24194/g.55040  ORF Transcript_24194/g.55040 Transcript_24194/m.55040 type:complete len:218 (+) Transcript_24194:159-812(+)
MDTFADRHQDRRGIHGGAAVPDLDPDGTRNRRRAVDPFGPVGNVRVHPRRRLRRVRPQRRLRRPDRGDPSSRGTQHGHQLDHGRPGRVLPVGEEQTEADPLEALVPGRRRLGPPAHPGDRHVPQPVRVDRGDAGQAPPRAVPLQAAVEKVRDDPVDLSPSAVGPGVRELYRADVSGKVRVSGHRRVSEEAAGRAENRVFGHQADLRDETRWFGRTLQ